MSQTNYWPSVELQPKISWRCNAMLQPRVAAAAPAAPGASRGRRATSPQSSSDRKYVSTLQHKKKETSSPFTRKKENDSFHFSRRVF